MREDRPVPVVSTRRGDAMGAMRRNIGGRPLISPTIDQDGSDDYLDDTESNRTNLPEARIQPAGNLVGPPRRISQPPISTTPREEGNQDQGNTESRDESVRLTVPDPPPPPVVRQIVSEAKQREAYRKQLLNTNPPLVEWKQIAFQIVRRAPQLNQKKFMKPVRQISEDVAQMLNAIQRRRAYLSVRAPGDLERQVRSQMVEAAEKDAERAYSQLQKAGVF